MATTILRYFVDLTVLGVFNAVVVVVGALILDVPLIGTVAVITLGSYVPYVGLVAGAFPVPIALGADGTSTTLWMLLIGFLANGLWQTIVSTFAYGAVLDVSPLVLLITALLGATPAGVAGVALAARVAAIAAVHSTRTLRESRPPADTDGLGTSVTALRRSDRTAIRSDIASRLPARTLRLRARIHSHPDGSPAASTVTRPK